MRTAPSQTATVSLPSEMLETLDQAASQLSATRSELVRAALRDYLRKLRRDDAILDRAWPSTRGTRTEEQLAQRARQQIRPTQARKSA